MKAKDLMVPLREYLKPDNTLKEAANLLRIARRGEEKIGVKALPVLDEASYMYLMELGNFAWDGMVETFAKKAADKKVKELMTNSVITVTENSTLMECVDHMLKNDVKRVPVLDKENNVSGMLYEKDVFYEITKAMLNDNTGERK